MKEESYRMIQTRKHFSNRDRSGRARDRFDRAHDRAGGKELGIGLRVDNARRTVLARVTGLVFSVLQSIG